VLGTSHFPSRFLARRAAGGTSIHDGGSPRSVRPGAASSPVQEIMTVPGRLSKVAFAVLIGLQEGTPVSERGFPMLVRPSVIVAEATRGAGPLS
jgi:hypothetical protein